MSHRSFRFIISSALILAGINLSHARTLTADEALLRITSGSSGNVKTLSTPRSGQYRLRYSAPQGEYHVFTTEANRCLILSGDDRVAPVLADIPSTPSFNPDSLAPGAKWLLEVYRSQIASLPAEPTAARMSAAASSGNDIAALYSQWTDIAPIMTCAWNQHWPYNLLTPIKDGERCVTGCVATAMAQIIRTIGYARCSGHIAQGYGSERVEYDFDNTPIDFDNLLSAYNSADSEESQQAVARLMLACGLSVGMGYSPSESAAQSSGVDYALITNFGYDPTHTRYLSRSAFGTAKWETIIYTELSLGRPVYYSASSAVSAGHAFVIDGYRQEGLYHINWGWGGVSDGYFSLSLLTPTATNPGDTNRGYNIDQKLVKAVPPGADPGVVLSSMFGSITMVADGRCQVYYSGQGTAHSNIDVGVAIVAAGSDNILAWVPFWTGQSINESMSIRDYHALDLSGIELPAGNYRIFPATIADGESAPAICAESEGRQYYVELLVSPSGDYTTSNPENILQTSSCSLSISEIMTPELYSGFESELRMVVVNDGGADFLGTAILELTPEDGSSPLYRKTIYGNTFPAGTNSIVDIVFYANATDGTPLPAGNYSISLQKPSGESLLAGDQTAIVNVIDSYPPNYHGGGGLTQLKNARMIPSTLVSGEEWPHTPDLDNERQGRVELDVVFYRPGSNIPVRSYNVCNREIGSVSGYLQITPFTVDLPFGLYEVCYEANTIATSGRQPVSVGEKIGDMFYLPLSANSAAVCKSPDHSYSGEVAISPEINVSGTTYSVTAIGENAFSRCPELTTVHIPATVSSIGRNSFAYCPALQNILFEAGNAAQTLRNHMMPGASDEVAIYAPASAYDDYAKLFDAYQPLFARIESIESKSVTLNKPEGVIDIAITPLHPEINTEFTIEPLDFASSEMDITSVELVNGSLRIHVKAVPGATALYSIASAQPGVAPATLSVTFDPLAAISEIETDSASTQLYDLQGRPATDRRGYRIAVSKGRAKLIKF
ncbi:MAG: leucine-rich repeat protein [Bacteroides sp.]|nr:leucine-rich repeat protein [Bacteroides sp.]